MKMMGSAGSFVGPFFIGVTSDAFGSFTPAMLMLAACLLGAAAMQLFFHEPGKFGLLTYKADTLKVYAQNQGNSSCRE